MLLAYQPHSSRPYFCQTPICVCFITHFLMSPKIQYLNDGGKKEHFSSKAATTLPWLNEGRKMQFLYIQILYFRTRIIMGKKKVIDRYWKQHTFIASNVFSVLQRTLPLGKNGRKALTKWGFQGEKTENSFQI